MNEPTNKTAATVADLLKRAHGEKIESGPEKPTASPLDEAMADALLEITSINISEVVAKFKADRAVAENVFKDMLAVSEQHSFGVRSIAAMMYTAHNIEAGVEAMKDRLPTEEQQMNKRAELASAAFGGICHAVDPETFTRAHGKNPASAEAQLAMASASISIALAQYHPLFQLIAAKVFIQVATEKAKELGIPVTFTDLDFRAKPPAK